MTTELENLASKAAVMGNSLSRLVREAYDAGFRDGSLAMREHILEAAGAPVAIQAGEVRAAGAPVGSGLMARLLAANAANAAASSSGSEAATSAATAATSAAGATVDTQHEPSGGRAPRGLVQRAIAEFLSARPGSPIIEIENAVTSAYPVIARKTVGNQIRAFEGKLYRREGKYNWFLMGNPQTETERPLDDDRSDLF